MSELELQDAILRHALELQRLSAGHEAEADALMRQISRELRALLASGSLDTPTAKAVREVLAEADQIIQTGYSQIGQVVDTHELVLVVADKTIATLEQAVTRASIPSAARLASLAKDVLIDGSPASAWWARQAEDLAFKFAAQVRQGVLLEETLEQITGRIIGRGDEPGIMDAARRNVRTLVHSSVMTAANRARLETYKKNARHMKGIRWLATLDGRTCVQCMALDGAAWDMEGEGIDGTTLDFQLPPAHFSCRCVATPIAKGLDELLGLTGLDERMGVTTRASKDGPTTATTFSEFLRRQSPEFVEEMLGQRRALLWAAGKITLRDLVSGTGRELTLEEIKAR